MSAITAGSAGVYQPGLVEKTFEGVSAVKKDTNAFYSMLKFGNYALMGAEYALGNKQPFTYTMHKIGGGLSIIDAMDLFSSLHYWISGEFKKDSFCAVGANASLTLATVGGFVLWLGELGFLALGQIAAAIGNTPIIGGAFQALAEIGLGNMVGSFAALGFGFLAADAVKNIIDADNGAKRTKAILDLISSVAYVALYTLLLIPGICIPVIATLGVVASGFGLTSFLYKHYNQKEFV